MTFTEVALEGQQQILRFYFGGIGVNRDNGLSKNGVALSMSLMCMNIQPCW
jgi:hypothetical protein